jgi:hypothetical protein
VRTRRLEPQEPVFATTQHMLHEIHEGRHELTRRFCHSDFRFPQPNLDHRNHAVADAIEDEDVSVIDQGQQKTIWQSMSSDSFIDSDLNGSRVPFGDLSLSFRDICSFTRMEIDQICSKSPFSRGQREPINLDLPDALSLKK